MEVTTALLLTFTHPRLGSEVAETDAQWISPELATVPAMLENHLG